MKACLSTENLAQSAIVWGEWRAAGLENLSDLGTRDRRARGRRHLSLYVVDRLVSVNQEITTRTVAALRLTASAREAISSLARLEAVLCRA